MTQSRDARIKELAERFRAGLEEEGFDPESVETLVGLLVAYLNAPSPEEIVTLVLTKREAEAILCLLARGLSRSVGLEGHDYSNSDIAPVFSRLKEALELD